MKKIILCGIISLSFIGCQSNRIETLSMPKDVNQTDDFSETYLMKIARNSDLEKVKEALEKGADVTICNDYGLDAIVYAAMNEQSEVVDLLAKHGVNKSKVDISYVLKWGSAESAIQLVDLGCNPNYLGYTGVTPVYRALFSGNTELYSKLVKAGANLTAKNKDGGTLLHASILLKKKELVQQLLKTKCDVNAKDGAGVTPLQLAGKSQDYKLIQQLLDLGADVNAKDANDATLAFCASLLSDIKMMKLLIKNKADLTIKSRWGAPLAFSEKKKDTAMVELIKEALKK